MQTQSKTEIKIPDGVNEFRVIDSEQDEWEPIIDLSERQAVEFPKGIFPEWLETFIDQVATSTQSPREMSCMMAIGVLSTALMKKYHVQLDATWKVPLNTYSVLLAEPSERKTPTYKPFIYPINQYEREHSEIHSSEESNREFKRQTLAVQHKAKKQNLEKLAKDNASEKDIEEVTNQLKELSDELKKNAPKSSPVLTVSNITPEEFDRQIAENGETITIASSESTFFSDFGGAYASSGAKIRQEGILSSYEGDSYKVNRVKDRENGGGGLNIEDPLASVYVMVQPVVLKNIPHELKHRGLLDRFLYYKPKTLVGYRNNDNDPIDEEVKAKFNKMIYKALDIEKKDEKLLLDDAAVKLFKGFRDLIEFDLREGNQLSAIKGWGGKLAGNIGRIIGLLHVAEHLDAQYIPRYIKADTVLRAMDLSSYYTNNAKQTFDIVGIDEVDEVAYKILRLFKSHEKFKDESTVSMRDVKQYITGRGKQHDLLKEEAMFVLRSHNYVKLYTSGRKKMVRINPEFKNIPFE